MKSNGNESTNLIRRARQIGEAAQNARLREIEAMRNKVEAFISDPESWREYLRTLADCPQREPFEVVELTRYRLALGLGRVTRLMTAEEVEAAGRTPRDGAKGVVLTTANAMGTRRGETVFFTVEDTVAAAGAQPHAIDSGDRRVDTSDPAAMDAFVAAADRCDLDSLTPQAEYAVSACYGLDFEGDPVPPPPHAATAAELYDALEMIGRSVAEAQQKIDRGLAAPSRSRREFEKGARPPRERRGGIQREPDRKVVGRKEAERQTGPKAPTRDELCAMSAADVARAARGGKRMGRA